MGTRHLIMVVKDQKTVVAQYGQWDGYPDGQGTIVLNFIKGMNIQQFSERLEDCTFVSDDKIQELWVECGADGSGFADIEVADKFNAKCPQLSRDMGGAILKHIHQSEGTVQLQDASDFAKDSLMCEWAYVLDMDTNTLEVYEGFNTNGVHKLNRFQGESQKTCDDSPTYYPVALKMQWQFDNLPTKKEFIHILSDDENTDDFVEDEFSKDAIVKVIDNVRSGEHGNDLIVNRMCNYMEANMDDFIEAYSQDE